MFNRTSYFVREHVGLMKLTDTYDILDPATKVRIAEAREEIPDWAKALRLLVGKALLPTTIRVYQDDGVSPRTLQFSIRRGVALLRPKVEVMDAGGVRLGYFRSKLFSLGGAFQVFTADDRELALLKGDWKGWNFRFLSGGTELGTVTKKWAGLGKELFTTADNYIININGTPDPAVNLLLLAAGLAVDTVLKERK